MESESNPYSSVTRNVRVSVAPAPLEEQSSPDENQYAFSYTITLENLGESTVQLLERHWLVFSAGKQSSEVVGPGVVGVQPILEQGQTFQYTSGAVIRDPIGSMRGSYTFRNENGEFFQVDIPEFDLVYPLVIH